MSIFTPLLYTFLLKRQPHFSKEIDILSENLFKIPDYTVKNQKDIYKKGYINLLKK